MRPHTCATRAGRRSHRHPDGRAPPSRQAVMSADGLFLRDVELGDGRSVGVRLCGAHVAAIGPNLMPRGEPVVDGEGGALLPGLHDHHVHLLATAAVGDSVGCGPPAVLTWADLAAALARAQPRDGWIRGIGYDDGLVGPLARMAL